MSSQVFYRKWRPQTLSEVTGQEHVTRTLNNALKSARVSHAYLFCGPRGTGKTSTGRILAKAVNCLDNGKGEPCNACAMCQAITEGRALDVIEIDAASNRGIDEIRDLRERVNYAPNQARYKVYIIDEVHMLTKEASNALLKTLEEPPQHVIFVLATTEAQRMLPTILSRCQRFDFHRIPQAAVAAKLAHICQAEGVQVETEALRLIARSASGSLRDAENLLEQLAAFYGASVSLEQVQSVLGITGDQRVRELARHIVSNDVSTGMATISSVNSDGLDLRQFNRELVEYLRSLMLAKTGAEQSLELTAEDIAELKDLAARASLPQILRAIKLFGKLEINFDNYSTLPLELALVDATLPPTDEGGKPSTSKVKEAVRQVVEPASVPATPPRAEAKPASPVNAEAKPATKPAAQPQPEPVTSGKEIDRLVVNWKQIITAAPAGSQKTNALAILRSAGVKPVAIENDTVVLSFKYDIHKEKMEKPENQKVAEDIISDFLGRTCHVRCVHEPKSNHLTRAVLNMGAQFTNAEEK